jgi:hypothetical protein
MPLTTADARRWLQRFDAAERADRDARRSLGPRPQWSIALALSLLDAARTVSGGAVVDPRRAQQDEAVRRTWQRLRASIRP